MPPVAPAAAAAAAKAARRAASAAAAAAAAVAAALVTGAIVVFAGGIVAAIAVLMVVATLATVDAFDRLLCTFVASVVSGLFAPAVANDGLAAATAVVSRFDTKPALCASVSEDAAAAAAGLLADAVDDANTACEADATEVTELATDGAIKLATLVADKDVTEGAAATTVVLVAARVTVPVTTVELRLLNDAVDVTGVEVTAASTAWMAFWNTALLTVLFTVVVAVPPVTAPVTAVVVLASMVCTAAVVWISAGLVLVTGSAVIRLTPDKPKFVAVDVVAAVTAAAVGADAVPTTGGGKLESTEACTRLVRGVSEVEPGGAFSSPTKAVPELMSTPPELHTMCWPLLVFCAAVKV